MAEFIEKQHIAALSGDEQRFCRLAFYRPDLEQLEQVIQLVAQHNHAHGYRPVRAHDGHKSIQYRHIRGRGIAKIYLKRSRGAFMHRAQSDGFTGCGQYAAAAGTQADSCFGIE